MGLCLGRRICTVRENDIADGYGMRRSQGAGAGSGEALSAAGGAAILYSSSVPGSYAAELPDTPRAHRRLGPRCPRPGSSGCRTLRRSRLWHLGLRRGVWRLCRHVGGAGRRGRGGSGVPVRVLNSGGVIVPRTHEHNSAPCSSTSVPASQSISGHYRAVLSTLSITVAGDTTETLTVGHLHPDPSGPELTWSTPTCAMQWAGNCWRRRGLLNVVQIVSRPAGSTGSSRTTVTMMPGAHGRFRTRRVEHRRGAVVKLRASGRTGTQDGADSRCRMRTPDVGADL